MNDSVRIFTSVMKPVLVSLMVVLSIQSANAKRSSETGVRVTVTYEISMPRPHDNDALEEAMRKAREMVYSRVNLECVEMKRHIAETCKLTQLDVNQGTKAGRREDKLGSLNIRANARYRIELKKPQ